MHADGAPVGAHDHEGGVRVLTLDRPPANAIDESLLLGLDGALRSAEDDDGVRAVVLTGAGRFFSGGFDLGAPPRGEESERTVVTLYRDAHRRLLGLPKPTVALVNGHAIAGGAVLALACDVRIAVDGDWKVGLNEVAIGASFPTAAMEIVRARLTAAATAELLLGAELHGPDVALRLGIVERLVSPVTSMAEALAVAARLGSFPREVFAHTKQALVADALARIDATTIDGELAVSALWRAPESRAARAAQRSRLRSS